MGRSSGGFYSLSLLFLFCFLLTKHGSLSAEESSTSQDEENGSTLNWTPATSVAPHFGFSDVKVAITDISTEMPVPGGKFRYTFTVTNTGSTTRNITVTTKVDNYMLIAVIPNPTFALNQKQSHTGTITVTVNRKARPGLERRVFITITDNEGRTEHYKRFIVVREEPVTNDANPPELIFLDFVTSCKKSPKKHTRCGTGNWTVLFSAQDTESGLSIIDVDDHTISTVWTEDYSQGQVIRPINGKISTDCCRKRTVIIVTDNNGNTIRIPIYFPDYRPTSVPTAKSHRPKSIKMTAVVVSGFGICLLLVIIGTVTAQNWKKVACKRRNKQAGRTIRMDVTPKISLIV
ncbi:Hypothetical predicted protein [Mytilus galloprovincialis]|uniref:VWA7 Ig-like domain-containing protein n=2 Tax=Mytilus galloprovincialis TaxID=29158 RepID=A0A8B6BGC7_MYTGA|nr:Hypothetical predicted protein [Mytilus galloprovincialis]